MISVLSVNNSPALKQGIACGDRERCMRVDNTGIQCNCPAIGPCFCPDTYESQCVSLTPGNIYGLVFHISNKSKNNDGPLFETWCLFRETNRDYLICRFEKKFLSIYSRVRRQPDGLRRQVRTWISAWLQRMSILFALQSWFISWWSKFYLLFWEQTFNQLNMCITPSLYNF